MYVIAAVFLNLGQKIGITLSVALVVIEASE
jgi:hypothetical protein